MQKCTKDGKIKVSFGFSWTTRALIKIFLAYLTAFRGLGDMPKGRCRTALRRHSPVKIVNFEDTGCTQKIVFICSCLTCEVGNCGFH